MPHMLLSLAEWERDSIRGRTQAGVDRAAAEGRTGGRPPALDSEKLRAVRDFLANGGSVRAVKDGTYAALDGPISHRNGS